MFLATDPGGATPQRQRNDCEGHCDRLLQNTASTAMFQCQNARQQTNKQAANNAPSGFSPDHAVRRASILRNVAIYDLGKFTRFLSPVYRRARR